MPSPKRIGLRLPRRICFTPERLQISLVSPRASSRIAWWTNGTGSNQSVVALEEKNFLFKRIAAVLALLTASVLCSGCASIMKMSTRYKPLHPSNNTAVEFAVKANDGDGIARAELFVFESELFLDNGMVSARRRAGGTWGSVKRWDFPSKPNSINERHSTPGFPAASFIHYIVQVTDNKSETQSEDWYFAAGDWPFGDTPIPLFGNGAPANRIDIAFVADRDDYANAREMLEDLEFLIFDGYHTNNAVNMGKRYWQFYYSPQRGSITDFDVSPREMDIPDSVLDASQIDHAAIIHTTRKRDWARSGNFGTEPVNIGTAVHESGHAAFGLADEYPGIRHRASTDPHHNIYESEAECRNYNSVNGWAASDCEHVDEGWWRPEPASLNCIMRSDGDDRMPEFERTCINRIIWVYARLE